MRPVLLLAALVCVLGVALVLVGAARAPAQTSSETSVSLANENRQHHEPDPQPPGWRALPPALVARLRCPDPVCDPPPAPPPECDAAKAQERYEDAPEGSQYMLEHQVRICLDGQWSPWIGIGDDTDEEETSEPSSAFDDHVPWTPIVEFVIERFAP